jgi:phosphatidylglycerol lysyltransferase
VVLPGVAALLLVPVLSLAPHRFDGAMPPLGLLATLLAVAAVDVAAAGAAFWLFLPPDPALAFAAVLPAFTLALAAGLLSGTPGGVGPFEMTLLALLPEAPQAELLAAILGFRIVYYAIPAVAGAAYLLLRPAIAPERTEPPALSPAALRAARRAEAGLARQGELAPVVGPGAVLLTGVTPQALVAVGDPIAAACPARAIAVLRDAAAARARRPLFYKCGARVAARARRAGWTVVAAAEEAWIAPARFRLDTPAHRGLRRKLRASEAAGVTVVRGGATLPIDEMAEVAAAWAIAHGGSAGSPSAASRPTTWPGSVSTSRGTATGSSHS